MPQSAGPRWLVVVLLLLGTGCEPRHYSIAVRENNVATYQRFLTRYPEGERAQEVHRRLERLHYWEARRADLPLAYNLHVQRYPGGTFVEACRKRLAELALQRARTPADLELVLERFPGSDQARDAERRLPGLLAREALRSADPVTGQRFLARFPGSPQAGAVRERVAALRYQELRDEVTDLEAFVDEFSGTPQAGRALSRLERLLAETVRETRSARELERFRVRFPRSTALEELGSLVRQERLGQALARIDLEALRAGSDDADLVFLRRWCIARPAACASLREQSRLASPWRSMLPLDRLSRQAYAADPQQAWAAIDQLAWTRVAPAADLLLELVGSERLSTVWAAERALGQWLENRAAGSRRRWVASRLARGYRAANPDETQRRAHLLLLSRTASADQARQALTRLRALAGAGSNQLTSAYLLALWERRRGEGQKVGRATLVRFTAAARARLKWLQEAFPAELHPDSLFSAILAERELFALVEAERAVSAGGPSAAGLDEVAHEAAGLLAEWQRRMAGKEALTSSAPPASRPTSRGARRFVPASTPSIRAAVVEHEEGRGAALKRVLATGRAGRLVARGLCRRQEIAPPGCVR